MLRGEVSYRDREKDAERRGIRQRQREGEERDHTETERRRGEGFKYLRVDL